MSTRPFLYVRASPPPAFALALAGLPLQTALRFCAACIACLLTALAHTRLKLNENIIKKKVSGMQGKFGTTANRFSYLEQSKVAPGPGYYTQNEEKETKTCDNSFFKSNLPRSSFLPKSGKIPPQQQAHSRFHPHPPIHSSRERQPPDSLQTASRQRLPPVKQDRPDRNEGGRTEGGT